MKATMLAVSSALAIALLSGCAGISTQSYGSHPKNSVSEGATRADVIMNLGEPDSVYRSTDSEAFIYKAYKGKNILGLYSSITRTDKVVIMDASGVVLATRDIEIGKGKTYIMSPAYLDATHPVRTDELTEKPENYTYDWSFEQGQ
jgi:hypothetical protein